MIKILTTTIHNKISGGNIFNVKLYEFLKNNSLTVGFEIIENLNEYNFKEKTAYIIDGILIENNIKTERLKNHNISFLIHLWSSLNVTISNEKKIALIEIEKQICENFTVFVTGKSTMHYIENSIKSNTKNCVLVEPAIDKNWQKKANFEKLPKKIIYLSNFIEGKGHFKLIEVVNQLKNFDFTVDCFGEILSENYFLEFKNKIEDLGLKNIVYKQKVNHNQINTLLLDYDLLFHFSDYESFGMSVLETIATNIPFVITPTGNYLAYKNQNLKGILNTFENVEIKNYVEKILTSKTFYQEHISALLHFKTPTWEENFKPILSKIQKS